MYYADPEQPLTKASDELGDIHDLSVDDLSELRNKAQQ